MQVGDTTTLASRVIGLFADPAGLQFARGWLGTGPWNSTGSESVSKPPADEDRLCNARGPTDGALVRVTEVNSLRILMFIMIGEKYFVWDW